jgi:hypothetical protein
LVDVGAPHQIRLLAGTASRPWVGAAAQIRLICERIRR